MDLVLLCRLSHPAPVTPELYLQRSRTVIILCACTWNVITVTYSFHVLLWLSIVPEFMFSLHALLFYWYVCRTSSKLLDCYYVVSIRSCSIIDDDDVAHCYSSLLLWWRYSLMSLMIWRWWCYDSTYDVADDDSIMPFLSTTGSRWCDDMTLFVYKSSFLLMYISLADYGQLLLLLPDVSVSLMMDCCATTRIVYYVHDRSSPSQAPKTLWDSKTVWELLSGQWTMFADGFFFARLDFIF